MSVSPNNLIRIRANTTDSWLDITEMIALGGFSMGSEELVDESSGRTIDGTMHNNIIASKEFYDISFLDLTPSQMANVMNVLKGRSKIYMKYPSPFSSSSTSVSKAFYCQGRSAKMRLERKSDGTYAIKWTGLSLRVAEI